MVLFVVVINFFDGVVGRVRLVAKVFRGISTRVSSQMVTD